MELKGKQTYWTHRANKDLKKIFAFNKVIYDVEMAKEIAHKIRERTLILENPEYNFEQIGSIDESFSHLKFTYRKLIEGYCKITYRVGKSKIYIVRVFDTRQHPSKNL
ncbi:MAG: type II toxin-antitoxin system RelE/ParE family toxin [Aequorivita sp.]